MIVNMKIESTVEYNSLFTSIYRKDELILRYNKPVYDMYQSLKKVHLVFDEFNVKDIYLSVNMINIKDTLDKYIVLNNAKLDKFTERHYYNNYVHNGKLSETDGLFIKSNIPSLDTLINNKYHLLFKLEMYYDNYFNFQFDGDTGDKDAGDEVRIKNFNSSHRPADKDIVGATVKWVNKDGDEEKHKITWIRSDKRYVKFDGDIKDTASKTQADRVDITTKSIFYTNENKLIVKG